MTGDWLPLVTIIIGSIILGIAIANIFTLYRLSEVEAVIMDVHMSNDYIPGNYTCHDYTVDAVMRLRELGYETYYVAGNNNAGPGHAWVKVCRDYDVTAGVTKPNTIKFNDTSIIEITEDGKPNGEYCPWMKTDAWCRWCEKER